MKVEQIIVKHSERFIKAIEKLLPKNDKTIFISYFEMKKTSGYGNYHYNMGITIDGNENITLRKLTHDSIDYDQYKDLEYRSHKYDNWVKKRILKMLSDESIKEEINFHISK